jgi:hypothetical protein
MPTAHDPDPIARSERIITHLVRLEADIEAAHARGDSSVRLDVKDARLVVGLALALERAALKMRELAKR